jgi:hypothetical protein
VVAFALSACIVAALASLIRDRRAADG